MSSRMQFLDVKKCCSVNVFSDTKQKDVCWKICKVRKAFGCVPAAYHGKEKGFLSETVL